MIKIRDAAGAKGIGALLTVSIAFAIGVGTAGAALAPPAATTGQVTSVRPTSALVAGTINPNGSATSWFFEWGPTTTTSYGSRTVEQTAGAGKGDVAVTGTLSGLSPATSYHYRIVAKSNVGVAYGSAGIFNTSAAPLVATGPASDLTATSAALHGIVNPEALATSWYFEYGPTTKYGLKTPTINLVASPNSSNVSADITKLSPRSTYHFRLVATSTAGTSLGADFNLTTGLAVTLNSAVSAIVYGGSVVLSGTVASGAPGDLVTIESERFNQAAFSGIATVTTGSAGTWSYSAQPTPRTMFEAVTSQGASSPTVVSVAPSVSLAETSAGLLSTKVTGATTFGAHVLQLQRLSNGLWVTWKHVLLDSNARATFATSLPKGRTDIRMAIGPFIVGIDQAAPGYIAGYSRVVNYKHS